MRNQTVLAVALSMSCATLWAAQVPVLAPIAPVIAAVTADTKALQQLSERLRLKHEADEAAVQKYLKDNPTVSRTQVINGKVRTIIRIDEKGQPVYRVSKDSGGSKSVVPKSNVESSSLIKADSLYPGGSLGVNITGTGMIAGVWEPGLPRTNHELLDGKSTIQDGQATPTDATTADNVKSRNHATHVTGTMVGKDFSADNSKSAQAKSARGIAYGATAKNWDSNADDAEMAAAAADTNSPLLVSNHSYGLANDATTPQWQYGAYDAEAKTWDTVTKLAPFYLPFVAAGNEQQGQGIPDKGGYDIMTAAAASKNAVTVGAVNADKTMSDYSNWGPTDDGRVKPEIVARGTGINSSEAFDTSTPPVPSTTAYSGSSAASSGTSYATPAASAGALLLQQYYNSLNPGKYMRASTLKTLIMGTAEDLGQTGPDYKFGYGLMNVEAAANAIKKNSTTITLSNGNVDAACAHGTATNPNGCNVLAPNSKGALIYEWNANPTANSTAEMSFNVVAKGGTPLVVNLGWTDDEFATAQVAGDGIDPTTNRMVYDFDVAVRAGAFSRPWVLPGMANRTADATQATTWFQANGGPFRQVIVASPTAGQAFTIYVRKKTGSPDATRTLSLVVTGLAESTTIVNNTSTGNRDVSFASSSGTLTNVTSTDPVANGYTAPAGKSFTNAGLYAFQVTGVGNGGTTTVTITLPAGTNPIGYVKCNATTKACVDFPAPAAAGQQGAVINGNVITLTLVDGVTPGDSDAIAGQITDPGAPVVASSSAAAAGGGGAMGLPVLFTLGGIGLMGFALRRNKSLV